jgi:MATE family multidrug resistance protein
MRYLPYCALAPIVGFAAWQLDGIFIGTTKTREMRNAGIAALAIYIAAHHVLTPKFDKDGIWLAFLTYYIARAGTLCVYVPKIRKQMKDSDGH